MTDHPRLEVPFDEVEKWEEIEGSCARLYAAAEWGYKQALATPSPEPPADSEVAELVARLKAIRNDYGVQHSADCQRAAELLERTATPPPKPPTDEQLWAFWNNHDGPIPAILRAALERWGHR